jgi:hypothetical protein
MEVMVSSVIQIDQALIAILSPKAKLKIRGLIDLAIDLQSAFASFIARQERIREELGLLRSQQTQAVERARVMGTDEKDAFNEFQPAIAELEGELKRLEGDRNKREQRRYDSAQLVAQLREFLQQAANRGKPLTHGQPGQAQLRADESPVQAVTRLRAEIAKLQQELINIRRQALPISELKLKAREYVRELSVAGAPSLHVAGGAFRVDWQPGAWATQGTLAPAGAPLIAWLFQDQMIARLDELIDKVANTGLPASKRGEREYQIQMKLVTLELEEEAIIERFESEFPDHLLRRPNADPMAVLGIRFGLAAKQAS